MSGIPITILPFVPRVKSSTGHSLYILISGRPVFWSGYTTSVTGKIENEGRIILLLYFRIVQKMRIKEVKNCSASGIPVYEQLDVRIKLRLRNVQSVV